MFGAKDKEWSHILTGQKKPLTKTCIRQYEYSNVLPTGSGATKVDTTDIANYSQEFKNQFSFIRTAIKTCSSLEIRTPTAVKFNKQYIHPKGQTAWLIYL